MTWREAGLNAPLPSPRRRHRAAGLPSIPDRVFLGPMLLRGIGIWTGIRVLVVLGGALIAQAPPTLQVTPAAAAWLTAIAGLLGLLESRRRNEHILHANLGVGQPVLAAIAALPAALAELALAWWMPA